MATNLSLDPDLIDRALKVSGERTKKAAVTRALQMENMEIPGGRIETPSQEFVVRTRGRIQTPADFGDIVVAQRPGGPIDVYVSMKTRSAPQCLHSPRLAGPVGDSMSQ